MNIGIDKGHTLSGAGTGASGCGKKEELLTREVGVELIKLLEKEGHNIVDCTCDKASSSSEQLKKRVDVANKHNLDLFLSIHFNAFNGSANGVECIVSHKGTKAYDEATRVCNNISKLGYKNRGVKINPDIYVTRNTKAPAFLIECCFIDNASDMSKYDAKKLAKAIAEGILNKTIVDNVETSKKGVYRVICGSYEDKNKAIAHQKELKEEGFDSFLAYYELQ